MQFTHKQIDAITKLYTCGTCEVELVLVWIDKSYWYIHCPECQTEFEIKVSMRSKEIDCRPEEKTDGNDPLLPWTIRSSPGVWWRNVDGHSRLEPLSKNAKRFWATTVNYVATPVISVITGEVKDATTSLKLDSGVGDVNTYVIGKTVEVILDGQNKSTVAMMRLSEHSGNRTAHNPKSSLYWGLFSLYCILCLFYFYTFFDTLSCDRVPAW